MAGTRLLSKRSAYVFAAVFAAVLVAQAAFVPPGAKMTPGPQPGEVFKEYPFTMNIWAFGVGKNHNIVIGDLKDATKAELGVEYWGGHVGTSEQRLIINGNTAKAVHYALPQNTPTRPECYHHQTWGNANTEIPLSVLKQGTNTFQFQHGKQICYSWNWPQTLTYGLIFRVYYKSTKPHPTGNITSPKSGATIGENPVLTASVKGASTTYFVGYYEDFDWEGNGLYTQWHWATRYTKMNGFISKGSGATPRATWQTSKIPDQKSRIKIAAILVDSKGYRYMTKAADNLVFKRTKSVALFKPIKVPEFFCVRSNRPKQSCMIKLDKDIKKASKIEVIVSSWSCEARHGGVVEKPGTGVYINGKMLLQGFGRFHAPDLDVFNIPQSFFKPGVNVCTFEVRSTTKEHACEINIPGPVIRAYFDKPDNVTPPPDTSKDTTSTDTTATDTTQDTTSAIRDFDIRGGARVDLFTQGNGFTYHVWDAGPFAFEIMSVDGKRIGRVEGMGPTVGKETFDRGKMPSGVYFGRIVSGVKSVRKKIIMFGK